MDALETGRRIQALRKRNGWTQKDLAERLCVTDKSVSKWERGLNYPDIAILEPLAKTLGTTVVELLGIENIPEEEKIEAVTTVAAEETTKLRKEIKERALVILVSSLVLLASQYVLSYTLVNNGIYDTLTRALTLGMSSFTAMLIGNAIWIWWKHRK